MTEQSQTKLSYSRDFLVTFSNVKKHDPIIQTLFKDSLKQEKSVPQVPMTVERSRNLRPEAKKQEQQYLTPSNMASKWKNKGPCSPESTRKPVSKDRQWRPSPTSINKENVVNTAEPQSVSKSKFGAKANVAAIPTWEAVKAFPEGKSQKPTLITPREHNEESQNMPLSPVVVKVVSASPDISSPSPSPSGKTSASKSPSQLLSPSPSPHSPSGAASPSSPKSGSPKIIDEHQMDQRQKQVDYGYQTLGYLRYRLLVPKDKRSRDDPRTPKKSQACSKRSWDGQIKKWRRDLHQWDPEDHVAFMSWLESDFVIQMIKNNIGTELLDLLKEIKERAAKFENTPVNSPSPSPASGKAVDVAADVKGGDDLDKEKIVRKLVF